jgi:hypothetical protein
MEKTSEYSEIEIKRRRDEALRRALSTPPKPHNPSGKKAKSPRQKRAARGRVVAHAHPVALGAIIRTFGRASPASQIRSGAR